MTPQGIADLRERAKVEPWPWNKVLAAHAEWQDANRQTFEAAGDADAESAAVLRRAAAGDAIRQASQNAAEVFISSLSFALELYPRETRRVLRRLMRKEIRRAVIALRKGLAPRLEKSEALLGRVVDMLADQDGDA